MVCNHDVRGSIPLRSTIYNIDYKQLKRKLVERINAWCATIGSSLQ